MLFVWEASSLFLLVVSSHVLGAIEALDQEREQRAARKRLRAAIRRYRILAKEMECERSEDARLRPAEAPAPASVTSGSMSAASAREPGTMSRTSDERKEQVRFGEVDRLRAAGQAAPVGDSDEPVGVGCA